MKDLLAIMLVAQGPSVIDPRNTWSLHRALKELHGEAGRQGRLAEWRAVIEFKPCPDVGWRAMGADEALFKLWREGAFTPSGCGRAARLAVQENALVAYRKQLLALDPTDAQLVYSAGARWAALACTDSKKPSTRRRSSTTTVSSTPKRRQSLSVAAR